MQGRKSDNFNTLVITSTRRKVKCSAVPLLGVFVLASCRRRLQVSHLTHDWLFCPEGLVALSWTLRARCYLTQQPWWRFLFVFELINSSMQKCAQSCGFTMASAGPHMYNYIHMHTNWWTLSPTQTDAHKHKISICEWGLCPPFHTQINTLVAKKMMACSLVCSEGADQGELHCFFCAGWSLTNGASPSFPVLWVKWVSLLSPLLHAFASSLIHLLPSVSAGPPWSCTVKTRSGGKTAQSNLSG